MLLGHHPGRLVYPGAEPTRERRPTWCAVERDACLQRQQCLTGHGGQQDRVPRLFAVERAGSPAVDIERAEVDAPDLDREREHRGYALLDRGGPVRGPLRAGPVVEVGHPRQPASRVGVDARTFAQHELEFLEPSDRGVGDAHGGGVAVVVDEHDPGPVDREHLDAGATHDLTGSGRAHGLGGQVGAEPGEALGLHQP